MTETAAAASANGRGCSGGGGKQLLSFASNLPFSHSHSPSPSPILSSNRAITKITSSSHPAEHQQPQNQQQQILAWLFSQLWFAPGASSSFSHKDDGKILQTQLKNF
jgi:hypothetical protein